MQSFLINFTRRTAAASGYDTANVALVRHVGGEADPFALIEDRCENAHVGCVRAAAEIRMIDNEGIAGVNLMRRESFQNRRGAGGKSPHVERQDDMLRDHLAVDI